MQNLFPWIVAAAVMFVVVLLKDKLSQMEDSKPDTTGYVATPLLTKYEYKNYQGLKEYAAAHGLMICPKVRLADLVNVKSGYSKSTWQKKFNRICSKHVDFVLCDPDLHVKLIVELDDRSHERQDRIERDSFVDAVLTGAGYKIAHIRAFDDAGVAALDAALGVPKEPVVKLARTGPTFEEWKAQQEASTIT